MPRAVRASILALVAILVMVGAPAAAVAQTEPADAKPTADGGKPMPLGGTPTSAVAPATTRASLQCFRRFLHHVLQGRDYPIQSNRFLPRGASIYLSNL